MSKNRHLSGLIPALVPILLVLGVYVVAYLVIDYRPFHTVLSQQLLASTVHPLTDWKEALPTLEEVVRLAPDDCGSQDLLAMAYHQNARTSPPPGQRLDPALVEQSIGVFQELFRRCEGSDLSTLGHWHLSWLYEEIDRPHEALKELNAFVDDMRAPSGPTDAGYEELQDAYDRMSRIYASSNDFTNAFWALTQRVLSNDDYAQDLSTITKMNAYLRRPDTQIDGIVPSHPLGFGRYSAAALTSDNMLHILSTARLDPRLILYSTTKDGKEWAPSSVLMAENNPMGAMAVDSASNVHLAFAVNQHAIIYTNTHDGLSSRVIVDISRARVPTLRPTNSMLSINSLQLAVDSEQRAHLVWHYGGAIIGYSTISDHISTTPIVIATDGAFPDVKITSSGSVSVVYSNSLAFPDPDAGVWFMESYNGAWSNPVRISDVGVWTGAATLAILEDGSIHVIYITGQSPSDAKLMHVSRTIQGKWSVPGIIGEGTSRPWIPISKGSTFGGRTTSSLKTLPNNRLLVAWRAASDGNRTPILIRELKDGVWSPVSSIGAIQGEDYLDTQSFVLASDPSDTSVRLVWSKDGQPFIYEWEP